MYCERARSDGSWSASTAITFLPCTVMRTCTVPYRLSEAAPSKVLVAPAEVAGVVVEAGPVPAGAVGVVAGVVADPAGAVEGTVGTRPRAIDFDPKGEVDLNDASAPRPASVRRAAG